MNWEEVTCSLSLTRSLSSHYKESNTFYHKFHTVVPSLENMSTDDIERELLWAKKALEMRRLVLLRNSRQQT